MSAQFFWDRMQRAIMMDETNKILGKPTPYLRDAIEWTEAYTTTLSGNKKKDFDKEWKKLDDELAKKQKG
jgi:hypothetical protein